MEAPQSIPGDNPAPWGLLHDGYIVELKWSDQTLIALIECEYLRERFAEPGKLFVYTMHNCRHLAYTAHDGSKLDARRVVAETWPGISCAEYGHATMRVMLDEGILELKYDSLSIGLDNGEPVALERLDQIAVEYWDEWEKENSRNRRQG